MSTAEWLATLVMVAWVVILGWAIINADRRAEREERRRNLDGEE